MGLQNQLNLELIPAILAKDKNQFIQRLRLFEQHFHLVQVDCIDGKFVKNRSYYTAEEIESIQSSAQWELHLMVQDPLEVVEAWKDDMRLKRVAISYESFKNEKEILNALKIIKKLDKIVGLAINPDTPIKALNLFVEYLDYVLVLGVMPGYSGQKFIRGTYRKIKKIRKAYPMLPIEVDGGVSLKNAKKLIQSGATMLATASALSKDSITEVIQSFRKIIDKQKINLL